MRDPASWAMVSVTTFFVAFLVWKVRHAAAPPAPEALLARSRFKAARGRIEEAGRDRVARADALREAALVALEELKRPQLAARLARRADRLAPESEDSVATVVRAMRAAGRFPALERLLWRKLDAAASGSERYEQVFAALLDLYDGPLRRPHQASALRRLRAGEVSRPAG
jgi:hypothetical protein